MWTVRTSGDFDRAVSRLDRQIARRVMTKLYGLADLKDPTARCKPLTGPLVGLWRLRVGDYRVILDVHRDELVIVALDVDHRSSIYDT
ncbi:type II toxin-antitoxin system RelE/ParE family toxin [Brevibacterium sp. Mu109]|uniref:type II toxin-antitoxin system RelE family toxin n=1 Tax=Brevibacterium sp. Mu109 TaxID=1255669 RepID=UPI000C78F47C|nr:type II toxin-antitoxin system RelE/ParE family toxin [Brevibacterium sp. Mu109]